MKAWLKGGLIGLAVGYIGYIIAFLLFYQEIVIDMMGIEQPGLISSIPSFTWFIIYSLIFFVIGAIIGLIIQKIKNKS